MKQKSVRGIGTNADAVGYATIAYNCIMFSKFDPTHINPLRPVRGQPNPPFPKLDPRVRAKHGVESLGSALTQLSRLTVVLDKDAVIKSGTGFVASNSHALQQYDLLAAMPLTETAFQHACITLSELKPFSIDIITLDLAAAPRLPFILKRSTVSAALANGVVFEITYGDALQTPTNVEGSGMDLTAARRNVFSGAREILRVTNGKGVILSSAARDALGLRAPYDVMNFAALMGLTPTAAKDAISATCKSLLVRAQTRQTFRGAASQPSLLLVKAPASRQDALSTPAEPRKPKTSRKRKVPDAEEPDL